MHHELISLKPDFVKKAHLNQEQYQSLYRQSVETPEKFWGEQAKRLTWFKQWTKVK